MTRTIEGFTVDELATASGYSVGTIQDFTHQGIIPKPVRWLDPALGKKGLYPPETAELLTHYRWLMSQGRGKDWAKARMQERLAEYNMIPEGLDVQICEGRGQGAMAVNR